MDAMISLSYNVQNSPLLFLASLFFSLADYFLYSLINQFILSSIKFSTTVCEIRFWQQ